MVHLDIVTPDSDVRRRDERRAATLPRRSARSQRRTHGSAAAAAIAVLALALAAQALVACGAPVGGAGAAPPPAGAAIDTMHAAGRTGAAAAPAADTITHVVMQRVDFYVDPKVVLHIHTLNGTMRSKTGGPVVFDDKTSFIISIDRAEVGLTGADVTALLNKYVFAYPGSPLSDLKVRMSGDQLVQAGHLHKGVDLPFEITAAVSVTPDGRIRLHPTKTKILGVDGQKLMDALHLSLEKLIDLSGAKGASVEGNDILLNPTVILPPPTIEGKVTDVRVEGDQLVQRFGDTTVHAAAVPTPPDTTVTNYMFYKGGTLRFGKLVMLDAELQITDRDPADPFKFELDRYNEQLVNGWSRTLPDLGLEVYMRDIDKIGTHVASTGSLSPPDNVPRASQPRR